MNLILSILCATIIFSPISLQAAQVGQSANGLSPRELKAMAPIISSENPKYSSLKVEAVFSAANIQTAIRYCVYFSKEKGYALYVRDMRDDTPIFLLTEKTALLFDPSEDELILFKDLGLIFELGMEGNDLRFVSAIRSTQTDQRPEIINSFNMDFISIFNRVTVNLKGKRGKEGRYIFSGKTELGNICVAKIDPSSLIPFLRVEFYRKDDPTPLLNFSRLEANRNINNSVFLFPMKNLLDRGLLIKPAPFNQKHFVDLMSLMGRILFVRSALSFPELRKDLKKLGINDSDWPEIEKRDKRVSPILRDVFRAR